MTWSEFKAAVEASGIKENDRMSYIDIGSNDLVAVRRLPGGAVCSTAFVVTGRTPSDEEETTEPDRVINPLSAQNSLLKDYMREVYEDDATVAVRCAKIQPELKIMMDEIRAEIG